jgi:hypothetical protein
VIVRSRRQPQTRSPNTTHPQTTQTPKNTKKMDSVEYTVRLVKIAKGTLAVEEASGTISVPRFADKVDLPSVTPWTDVRWSQRMRKLDAVVSCGAGLRGSVCSSRCGLHDLEHFATPSPPEHVASSQEVAQS